MQNVNEEPQENPKVETQHEEPVIEPKIVVEESSEDKAEKYLDQLLRLQAEFANYRKRTEKEKADAMRFGRVAILESMISLLDVMEQALKHSDQAKDVASLKIG